MLTEKFFDTTDTERIEGVFKKTKRKIILFSILAIAFFILIALISIPKSNNLLFIVAVCSVAMFIFLSFFLVKRISRSFQAELSEQIKLVGDLIVSDKSQEKDQYFIHFDSMDLGKLLVPKEVYGKITVGDKLTMEVSKRTNTILRLSKDLEILIGSELQTS